MAMLLEEAEDTRAKKSPSGHGRGRPETRMPTSMLSAVGGTRPIGTPSVPSASGGASGQSGGSTIPVHDMAVDDTSSDDRRAVKEKHRARPASASGGASCFS